MPEDNKLELPKEVADFLGVKGDTIDDFKKSFDSRFINREAVKDDQGLKDSIYGERLGSVEVKAKSLLKKAGVELSAEEIKDKKVEEVLEAGIDKLTSSYSEKIKELEQASGKTDDQALKDLQTKFESFKESKQKELDDLTGAHNDLKSEHDSLKENSEKQIESFKMNSQRQAVDSTLPWASDADFYKERRTAFEKDFGERYKTSLGEEGNILITDKDGHKIKNEDKAGEFLTYAEVRKRDAVKAELIKLNPKGGGDPPKKRKTTEGDERPPQPGGERVINQTFRPTL